LLSESRDFGCDVLDPELTAGHTSRSVETVDTFTAARGSNALVLKHGDGAAIWWRTPAAVNDGATQQGDGIWINAKLHNAIKARLEFSERKEVQTNLIVYF